MPTRNSKLVIFLAFANDRDNSLRYLRNLPDESRRLREVLEAAEQAGLCEVVVRSNCTAEDIFKVFQDPKYRNRIAIFHYGGHANGYSLLLESASGQAVAANAGGFSAFLAQQQGMQLVFLNGCSTQDQTQGLLDANVPVVISTSRKINDKVATDFAHNFYQGLASGASIQTAYKEAEAGIQIAKGDNTREGLLEGVEEPDDDTDTDRWPWDLYLTDGDSTADQWNLPQAVGDPLFGLPPLPQQDLPETPYRYLSWFTRDDAEVFFGRGHQIRDLYDRLTAPHSAPILLFYGQSGVGKSSVLDAGLIPRLEKDYEVRYARRTADGLLATLEQVFSLAPSQSVVSSATQESGEPVVEFLDEIQGLYVNPETSEGKDREPMLRVLKTIFGEPKRYLDGTAEGMLRALQQPLVAPKKDTPLASAWREQEERSGKPLIIILDQVEELYTHPNTALPGELKQFLQALASIFSDPSQRPKGRLVLGFRKEWLAELEAQMVQHKLPRTKVFLEPLDRRGVIEVVQGPSLSRRLVDRYRLSVDQELPEVIADDLLEDRDSAVAPTLQILLTKLWAKATEANPDKPNFSQPLYQDLKRAGILMRDFLEQQIEKLRLLSPDAVNSGLLLDLLAAHTTALGTAGQCSLAQLQQDYAHQGDGLENLLQQCQDLQLLTLAANSQAQGDATTRLAHDTLAPLVREKFEKSDKPGQRARRILDNRSVDWVSDEDGTPLDEADLAVVEKGAKGTRELNTTELRMLEASRAARAAAQLNRKRLKMAGLAAVVVIMLAGGYGWLKSIEANKARRETNEAIVKFAFQSFDDGPEETCNIADVGEGNYISKKSGYGLLCYIEKIVNLGDLQRMSKEQIFLSGPHHVPEEGQQLQAGEFPLVTNSNTQFGHYNPRFVEWVFANMLPSADLLADSDSTMMVYQNYLQDQVRIYYQVYWDLNADQTLKSTLLEDYSQRIAMWQGEETKYSLKSPGTFIQRTFSLYASARMIQSLDEDIISDFSEFESEVDVKWRLYYRYRAAATFWLRREMDSTADEFYSGLQQVLDRFDPEFLQQHEGTSPASLVDDYLVRRWTRENDAIDLNEDGTYLNEGNLHQGVWKLNGINVLNLDGTDYDMCTSNFFTSDNGDGPVPEFRIIEELACHASLM